MNEHNYQPKVLANNIRTAILEKFQNDHVSLPASCGDGQAFVLTTSDGTKYFINIQFFKE